MSVYEEEDNKHDVISLLLMLTQCCRIRTVFHCDSSHKKKSRTGFRYDIDHKTEQNMAIIIF